METLNVKLAITAHQCDLLTLVLTIIFNEPPLLLITLVMQKMLVRS